MDKPQRRSVRFAGFDYQSHGAYFITVCTIHHRPFFGRIENDAMQPNWVGKIVEREWLRVAQLRSEIALDEYVVMPNHFHAIVIIRPDMACRVGTKPAFGKPQSKSLAMVIGGFKSAVTRHINARRAARNLSPVVVWQGRFYDRIIRDETELLNTRRYIIENPQNWQNDQP